MSVWYILRVKVMSEFKIKNALQLEFESHATDIQSCLLEVCVPSKQCTLASKKVVKLLFTIPTALVK